MRLVRFNRVVEPLHLARLGVVVGSDLVADLGIGLRLLRGTDRTVLEGIQVPPSIAALLQMGEEGRTLVDRLVPWLEGTASQAPDLHGPDGTPLYTPLAECRLHAPVRLTKFIIARGSASGPFFMMKPTTAVVGPVREVSWPTGAENMYCAAGLAAVIGKACKNIPEAAVPDVIAGYMVANDITVRNIQLLQGKRSLSPDSFEAGMFEGFAPSGPQLVTPDEIGKLDDLEVELRVNGQMRHHYSTRDLTCSIACSVSFLSQMPLEAGDVVWSGGAGDEGTLIKQGDLVEATITGLGTIRNRIVESLPN